MTITQQFTERFARASDKKLIEMFNKEVGITVWGNARAEYLHVMRNEFLRRDFDSSLIISEQTFCLAKKIKVENAKLVFTEMEIQ
ncbi:hypothetical protein [Kaistella carnis]|uniref:hypothetical protein n=1 Tax=Kaistella carnis TaxID=1241979 RepID=UPI0028B01A71|nr:hypothetical protein [Kaistella carnis]